MDLTSQKFVERLWAIAQKSGSVRPEAFVEQISWLLLVRFFNYISARGGWQQSKVSLQLRFGTWPDAMRARNKCTELLNEALLEAIQPLSSGKLLRRGDAFGRGELITPDLPNFELMSELNDIVMAENELDELIETLFELVTSGGAFDGAVVQAEVAACMAKLLQPRQDDRIVDLTAGIGATLAAVVDATANDATLELNGFEENFVAAKLSVLRLLLKGVADPRIRDLDPLTLGLQAGYNFDAVLGVAPVESLSKKRPTHDGDGRPSTSRTEVWYTHRALDWLTEHGRCALVVPESLLYGETQAQVMLRRRLLLEVCLEAVISLPPKGFKAAKSSRKSVLLLVSRGITERIFMAQPSQIGELDKVPRALHGWRMEGFSEAEQTNSLPFWEVSLEQVEAPAFDLRPVRYQNSSEEDEVIESPRTIYDRMARREQEVSYKLAELYRLMDSTIRDVE